MDSFKEQIVRKNLSQKDKMTKYMLMIASVALAAGCFLLVLGTPFMMIGVLAAGLALFGGYQLTTRMDVEYEYIFTNGEVDIDKIVAQRSRKRLVTFKCSSVTAFGKAGDHDTDSGNTLVFASANEDELIDYYAEFNHKTLGKTTLVFTPDAAILSLIVKALPAQIRREAAALLDEIEADGEDEDNYEDE